MALIGIMGAFVVSGAESFDLNQLIASLIPLVSALGLPGHLSLGLSSLLAFGPSIPGPPRAT